MSKPLRKQLGARAQSTPLSIDESLELVRLMQPDRFQNHEPETPTRANHRPARTTPTLVTLALNAADPRMRHGHSPAPKPRNVLYMDGKGDPSVYAKTLAGLSERQSAGNLPVINLRPGQRSRSNGSGGRKVSHSLDLFEGFDESMPGR